jgi:hypothetical protein
LLARVRPLHGDHRQRIGAITPLPETGGKLPLVQAGSHPRQILGRRTGIDHEAVAGVVEVVDDQVVDHAAGLVEHRAVQGLARDLQAIDVVGDQAPQEGLGIGAVEIDRAHVRDVEHARVAAHGVVFLDLRPVVQGHFPATEIDHSCAAATVAFVEDSFLHRINP